MKRILIATLVPLFMFSNYAISETIIDLSCSVSGLKFNGKSPVGGYTEKIYIKHSVSDEGWGISNSEIISDGEKLESNVIALEPNYAVLAYSTTVGSGFKKSLLVFTYVLDLQAMELNRSITSLPKGMDERTTGKCK
ncbi:MAG: hypothetical protein Q9M12_08840 [Mariprofundus sp.]|nr:hypothetical protein [Mariprofundus sp.]